jgi:hypothetical protein
MKRWNLKCETAVSLEHAWVRALVTKDLISLFVKDDSRGSLEK